MSEAANLSFERQRAADGEEYGQRASMFCQRQGRPLPRLATGEINQSGLTALDSTFENQLFCSSEKQQLVLRSGCYESVADADFPSS